MTEITLDLAIFRFITRYQMNESNNKLFRCGNYNFEGTYEMRDINEFLKRAILQKHPRRDALETVDVVRGDNNNNDTVGDLACTIDL